jgi:hypothetical protein
MTDYERKAVAGRIPYLDLLDGSNDATELHELARSGGDRHCPARDQGMSNLDWIAQIDETRGRQPEQGGGLRGLTAQRRQAGESGVPSMQNCAS